MLLPPQPWEGDVAPIFEERKKQRPVAIRHNDNPGGGNDDDGVGSMLEVRT